MRKIINIIRKSLKIFRNYGNDVIVCKSIPHAFEVIEKIKDRIENIWVMGGSSVYKVRCLYKINENFLIII